MKKQYINISDKQGGTFGMYRMYDLKGWREQAMEWCYLDDNFGTYNALKRHKIKNCELIDFINDYWDIEVKELTDAEAKFIEGFGGRAKTVEEKERIFDMIANHYLDIE